MRWMCILICVAGLMACEDKSSENGGESTSDKIQSLTEQTHEAVDSASEWSQEFNAQMTDWSAKIEEVAKEAKEKGSAKAQELAVDAQVAYDEAKEKFDELKDATADERAAIQSDLKNLGQHIMSLCDQAKTALQSAE